MFDKFVIKFVVHGALKLNVFATELTAWGYFSDNVVGEKAEEYIDKGEAEVWGDENVWGGGPALPGLTALADGGVSGEVLGNWLGSETVADVVVVDALFSKGEFPHKDKVGTVPFFADEVAFKNSTSDEDVGASEDTFLE